MTRRTLERAIAKKINEEQHTGGRLASIGDSGHPATVASIVVEVLIKRGVISEGGNATS